MTKKRKTRKSKTNGMLAVQPSAGDFDELKAVGVRCGIDARAMEQLIVRLQGRPPSAEGRLKLDDAELLSLIDDKLARAFQNLDDFSLGQSSARDLSVTIGVLTDKRRLLRPEEGAVQRFQDMRKLDEVLKELHAEAVRRGWLDDGGLTPEGATLAANTGSGSVP